MPTDAISLVLYVGLLLPGFAFAVARSQHRPIEARSAFRETTSAVFVSVICDAAVIALLLLATIWDPPFSSTVAEFTQNPIASLRAAPSATVLSSLAFLAVATTFGWSLGTERAHRLGRWITRSLVERSGSSWHEIFEEARPEGTAHILVTVELTDGSAVQGLLYTFDRMGTDSPDRGLVLSGELSSRASGESDFQTAVGWTVVAITDRNIRSLQVAYLDAL